MFRGSAHSGLIVRVAAILAVSAGGMVWALDQILLELDRRAPPGAGQEVAVIERSEGGARRKLVGRYSWYPAGEGERFFHRESLQTGPEGGVTLALARGRRAEIGPSSLVIFDAWSEQGLSLVSGSAQLQDGLASGAGPLGQRTKSRGAEPEGGAPAQATSPEPGARLYAARGAKRAVVFRWSEAPGPRAGAEPSRVEIAADPKFKTLVQGAAAIEAGPDAGAGARAARALLGAGRYFWRVVSGDPRGPAAARLPARELRIDEVEPLRPLLPAEAAEVADSASGGGILFSWEIPASAQRAQEDAEHAIEVSASPGFEAIVASQAIEPGQSQSEIEDLPVGTRYWRLKSRYGDLELASAPVRIEVLPPRATEAVGGPLAAASSKAAARRPAASGAPGEAIASRVASSAQPSGPGPTKGITPVQGGLPIDDAGAIAPSFDAANPPAIVELSWRALTTSKSGTEFEIFWGARNVPAGATYLIERQLGDSGGFQAWAKTDGTQLSVADSLTDASGVQSYRVRMRSKEGPDLVVSGVLRVASSEPIAPTGVIALPMSSAYRNGTSTDSVDSAASSLVIAWHPPAAAAANDLLIVRITWQDGTYREYPISGDLDRAGIDYPSLTRAARIEVRGRSLRGYSAPSEAFYYCPGHVLGDSVVTEKDVATYLLNTVRTRTRVLIYRFSSDYAELAAALQNQGNRMDVDASGRIDAADKALVTKLMGDRCPF